MIDPRTLKEVVLDNDLTDLSDISDDDIYIVPYDNPQTTKIQPTGDKFTNSLHDQLQPVFAKAAQRRRKRKRNNYFCTRRYRFFLSRSIYCRFITKMIKFVLHEYGISYLHIKTVTHLLIIGVKNNNLQQEYEQNLPHYLFDRHQFYSFRGKYKQQH